MLLNTVAVRFNKFWVSDVLGLTICSQVFIFFMYCVHSVNQANVEWGIQFCLFMCFFSPNYQ